MIESLEREIRDLRALFWSERDPEGRGFAPLADAYRRAGDFRQALALLSEGLDRLPTFATGHVVSARVHLDAGLLQEAELAARRALELDAENVWALRTLAGALQASGDDAGALAVLARVHELEPTSEEALAEPGMAEPEEAEAPEQAEAEEPEVVDIAALAPDEGKAEEPEVVDIAALAPDEEGAEEPEVVDVAALAPDEEEMEEPEVVDVAALAPDEEEVEGPAVVDDAWLAPGAAAAKEPEVVDVAVLAPDGLEEGDDGSAWNVEVEEAEAPIYTRTIAELYVRQGLQQRALDVYRHLVEADPGNTELRARLAELEAAPGGSAEAGGEVEEETEIQAQHLAAAGERKPMGETPFAWTEDEMVEPETEAPPIEEYFRRMLTWSPDEEQE